MTPIFGDNAAVTKDKERHSSMAETFPVCTIDFLKAHLKGLYTPWRMAIVMVVLAAMLAGHVSTSWHASPDSALYMGLARSLIAGDGYTFNYAPHAMVPPLFPLIVAGEMKLFGESYLALNIGQAVFALACVPVAFALLRRGFGDDLAFVGTAMFALSHVLWRYSSMVITDVPFAFFAMLAMLAGMWAAGARKWLWARLWTV